MLFKLPTYPRYPAHDTVEYWVKADEAHNLCFPTRQQARDYKKLLKKSKAAIDGQIIKREYMGGYIYEERVS